MKTILSVTALAIAILIAGCGKQPDPAYSTPEKTLEALKKVVWEKSYGDYLNLLSIELRDIIAPQNYQDLISVWSGEYEIFKREETDPTHVNLHTKFYYDGYDKSFPKSSKGYRTIVFRFVLENGEWKLDETMLADEPNATTG